MLSEIKFLEKFKHTDKLKELCRYIALDSRGNRETIFEEGDPGDAFYVILNGTISVYVKVESEYSGHSHMKHVAQLKAGDSFGELALITGAQRSGTVITSEPTEMVVLSKKIYDSVIRGQHT